MSNHEPTLKAFAADLRPLMEEQRAIAKRLRDIMKEMRDAGLEGGILKQWLAAIIDADEGDERKLNRLKARTQDAAIYGEMLGYSVDGFGETKRFVVNDCPHDPETGEIEIEHQPLAGVAVEEDAPAVPALPIVVAAIADVPATIPSKPQPLPSATDIDPLWPYECDGMTDAIAKIRGAPAGLTESQLARWRKGYAEQVARMQEASP